VIPALALAAMEARVARHEALTVEESAHLVTAYKVVAAKIEQVEGFVRVAVECESADMSDVAHIAYLLGAPMPDEDDDKEEG
jgi:hypothetical protein